MLIKKIGFFFQFRKFIIKILVDQCHVVSQVDEENEILKGNLKMLPQAIWVKIFLF